MSIDDVATIAKKLRCTKIVAVKTVYFFVFGLQSQADSFAQWAHSNKLGYLRSEKNRWVAVKVKSLP